MKMKIDHIHILVKDLEGAMQKFSSILDTQFVGPIDHGYVRVAFCDAGIELIAPVTSGKELSDSPFAKRLEEQGEGVWALAFKVPNRDEAVKDLESKGVKCIRKKEIVGLKAAQTDPKDLYGVWLELVEYDEVPPIVVANMSKTPEFPFYKA